MTGIKANLALLWQTLRQHAVMVGIVALACALLYVGIDRALADRAVWTPTFYKTVTFLSPRWFLALSLLPVLWFGARFSLTDMAWPQRALQFTLRALTLSLVVAALARPTREITSQRTATIILVDVSESVADEQLAAAQAYVDGARPNADQWLSVVTFAASPRVAQKQDGRFIIARHGGEAPGTDIQGAMQLAYGLFPDGYVPSLVLLTDGNQTAGDLLAEAYRARSLGIVVSWAAMAENPQKEIRIAGITLPDEVKVGQPFEVVADVWSSHADTATLSLQQDAFANPLEPTKRVALVPGTNRITFKSQALRAGSTTYKLTLSQLGADTEKRNNVAVMTTPVKGRPRVLYIEGSAQRDPQSASYFKRALEHENMEVEVRTSRSIPSAAKEFEPFDAVVLSDVPAHFVSSAQMSALDAYVGQLGGGLIMAGGQDSFGSGGYQGTKIEDIMPVRFDSERDLSEPSIALMLVMDKSGSMEEGGKLEAAKESARATAGVLSPGDIIGVVAFDTQSKVFVRPQRASNRMRIATEISTLRASGGTNIYPGLRDAYDLLQGINAKVKHVILLSDGQAPTDGIAELIRDMRASRITVSAVGVAGASRSLLQMIVDAGEGRLYMVDDIGSLPRIFMKETTEVQKSQLVEDAVSVRIAKRVEAIEGTGVETAPPLRGYVTTKPKPTAEVILVSDLGEPILARWRHGVGTSVAWTSDVKNRWSSDWIRWANYPKFWAQVVRTTMRRKTYDSYDLTTRVADGVAQVIVDAVDASDQFVNELDTDLSVIDPATGKVLFTAPMQQTAAGRYTAHFSAGAHLAAYGSFLVKATHKRNGAIVAESLGSLSLPYPPEFQTTALQLETLHSAAAIAEGKERVAANDVFFSTGRTITYTQDVWGYVLILATLLFLLDLYAKRVRLFGYRTLSFDDNAG